MHSYHIAIRTVHHRLGLILPPDLASLRGHHFWHAGDGWSGQKNKTESKKKSSPSIHLLRMWKGSSITA